MEKHVPFIAHEYRETSMEEQLEALYILWCGAWKRHHYWWKE